MTIALCHLLDTANAKDVDAEEEDEDGDEGEAIEDVLLPRNTLSS